MNTGRVVAVASALIALVSVVLGFLETEGIMTVTALFALIFGIVASKRCSARTNRFILMASIVVLICTVLSVTVFSQENMIDSGAVSEFEWFYIMAIIHAVPMIPLAFASFVVLASVTSASYNWAIVRGLSPFIAMGMLVPGYVVEYFYEYFYVDIWMVDNGYILYSLLIMAVVMVVSAWLISRHMRANKLIITERGLEVLQ